MIKLSVNISTKNLYASVVAAKKLFVKIMPFKNLYIYKPHSSGEGGGFEMGLEYGL